jgi:hypothetical protein
MLQTTPPNRVSPAPNNGVWTRSSPFVTGLLSVTQILTRRQARKVMSKRDVSVSHDVLAFVTLLISDLERDSPRDQLVVTLFLLTVFGLLLSAGIKNRMLKAGMDPNIPRLFGTGRRWWEVCQSP